MSDDSGLPPIRKIDDATYGTLPQNPYLRRLLRVKRWFLLDANRSAVTGLLLGATFGLIVFVGSFDASRTMKDFEETADYER